MTALSDNPRATRSGDLPAGAAASTTDPSEVTCLAGRRPAPPSTIVTTPPEAWANALIYLGEHWPEGRK
jgi:hypothetical protein